MWRNFGTATFDHDLATWPFQLCAITQKQCMPAFPGLVIGQYMDTLYIHTSTTQYDNCS